MGALVAQYEQGRVAEEALRRETLQRHAGHGCITLRLVFWAQVRRTAMVAETVDRETGELTRLSRRTSRTSGSTSGSCSCVKARQFVAYPGLLDLLHQLTEGFFAIDTEVLQLPTAENNLTAVCQARVRIFDPQDADVVRRLTTGIGDADPDQRQRPDEAPPPQNGGDEGQGQGAAGRRQRRYGRPGGAGARGTQTPAPPVASPPVEGIVIEGRRFSRPEVVLTKRSRVEACQEAGIPMPVPIPADDAPLREQVGFSQRLRELLLQQRRASPERAQGQ